MQKDDGLLFIPCQVEPGMFKGEWLVFLEVIDPEDPKKKKRLQLLVDERLVKMIAGNPRRKQPVPAWLEVEVAQRKKGQVKVVLPQPAYPDGDTLLVNEEVLRQEVV